MEYHSTWKIRVGQKLKKLYLMICEIFLHIKRSTKLELQSNLGFLKLDIYLLKFVSTLHMSLACNIDHGLANRVCYGMASET